MKVKRLFVLLLAVLGLSSLLAPSALAEPSVPTLGHQVTYTVKSNKSFDAKVTRTVYYGSGPESSTELIRPYPSWTQTTYTKSGQSASSARLYVVDQGNIKGYGVPTYTCTVTIDGVTTSSNTGTGSVSC